MKKQKKLRQYALVALTDKHIEVLKQHGIKGDILDERKFIYFGEIPNMPGHCVVLGHTTEKWYIGYHIEDFRELTDEEV